jgi:hypothetical protein
MQIDDKLIDNLTYQIDQLRSLEQTVHEAIKTAEETLELIDKNRGKDIEDIIPETRPVQQ